MIVLGIETCSPSGGVALFDGTRLLGVQTIHSSRAHSRLILPAIRQMLDECDLAPDGIDVVAVSAGPGSFTGVRVGLTLGKALCQPGHPRLVLVSTLEALAWRAFAGEEVDCVVPLLNARQGEVYGAVVKVENQSPTSLLAGPFALPPADLPKRWEGRALLAGEGARVCLQAWQGSDDSPDFVLARADRFDPSPEQVALLGWREAEAGRFVDPTHAAPIYLREAAVSRPKKARNAEKDAST